MATLRDIRSQKITEILNAIKVVKLFNTEKFQQQRISNCRKNEFKSISKASYIFSGHITIGFNSGGMMSMVAIGSLIGLNRFDIRNTFTMIYLFVFVQISIGLLPLLLMFF